jgi:2-dehydro-3-deoxyphosphogluconate aldolase/(4S)-4-hydroxy-2-oxoglutarate aldolase
MRARQETLDLVEATGVVAIIRTREASRVRGLVDALAAGGVRALEITMTVPGAVELIASIAPTLPADFSLGAGTVTDVETTHAVIDAGASFIVSPVFLPEVVQACASRGVPSMPGCYTPTEIFSAWRAGADVIKVFPATTLGPGYLKDVRAPLPDIKLLPTGGVSVENAGEWIRAGAFAVGVGSALLDPAALAAGDYETISARARKLVENVARAREVSQWRRS